MIGAYLQRLSADILSLIAAEIERHTANPRAAIQAIFGAIAADLDPPTFRGCDQLALVIDGTYTSAAPLGPRGPAAAGPALADALIGAASV